MVRRTKFRALGGSRMYNEAIRGRQNGNPGWIVELRYVFTSCSIARRRTSPDPHLMPLTVDGRLGH